MKTRNRLFGYFYKDGTQIADYFMENHMLCGRSREHMINV